MPGPTIIFVAICLGCYLLGSINFSILFARFVLQTDLRKIGSGNPGFTNLLRLGNKKAAISVLILDISRGYFVIALCKLVQPLSLWPLMGIALLLGNLFPLYHSFKGGKGIAMSIGIVFAISPPGGGAGILALALLLFLSRRVSVGSLGFLFVSAITCGIACPVASSTTVGVLALLGTWRHRANIKRLLNGTEPRILQ